MTQTTAVNTYCWPFSYSIVARNMGFFGVLYHYVTLGKLINLSAFYFLNWAMEIIVVETLTIPVSQLRKLRPGNSSRACFESLFSGVGGSDSDSLIAEPGLSSPLCAFPPSHPYPGVSKASTCNHSCEPWGPVVAGAGRPVVMVLQQEQGLCETPCF